MSAYLTPADLAEMFGATEETILRWRREHSWPSIKIGRSIRFSPEHVEQILATHEAKPALAEPVEVEASGQTARSARASRSA